MSAQMAPEPIATFAPRTAQPLADAPAMAATSQEPAPPDWPLVRWIDFAVALCLGMWCL